MIRCMRIEPRGKPRHTNTARGPGGGVPPASTTALPPSGGLISSREVRSIQPNRTFSSPAALDPSHQLFLCRCTLEAIDLVTAPVEDQSGKAVDLEAGGQSRVLVAVHLDDPELITLFRRDFLQDGRDHLTRTAPGRVHVEEQEASGMVDFRPGVGLGELGHGPGGHQSRPAEDRRHGAGVEERPDQVFLLEQARPGNPPPSQFFSQCADPHALELLEARGAIELLARLR
mmetsp:Transcript_4086/g.10625  ORF Transcript_4086/g.10625 Transcript_4086/m.10625 type:complete len:230 (-) Transcript_4086:360-1049(-)